MRRAAKVDVGQGSIVVALRAIGATVEILSGVGRGVPDLLVGWRSGNYLLEVKEPEGVRGGCSRDGQKLTPDQVRWHDRWRGRVHVVRSIDEAFDALGIARPGGRECA